MIKPLASSPPIVRSPEARTVSEAPATFRGWLRETAHSLAQGDRMLATVVARGPSAPPLDTAALLSLQAGVYRYTQELELAGRVVDRTTQAVKTTLQSQS